MFYKAELQFLQNLLKNFHIPCQIISEPLNLPIDPDLGLRRLLNPNVDFSQLLIKFAELFDSNTIYRIYDTLLCNYFFLKLPDIKTPAYLTIGPYLLNPVTTEQLLEHLEPLALPPELFTHVDKFFHTLPVLPSENGLLTMLSTFGTVIWGSIEQFSLQVMEQSVFEPLDSITISYSDTEPDEALLSIKLLERRYSTENLFLQAVAHGLPHKAEMHLGEFYMDIAEKRVSDPIRNLKNYTIILNTLLRKAVEGASVPLLHIDRLSSRYAREIEQISSVQNGYKLQKEMIRKYCLLVQNHNMKDFSPLIQKVLLRIDSDLSGDLSLKSQASLFNVNASYLSTLFKKETGVTLTEYVNRKRIEQAIFLLNSTNMQIQTIAQFCGIPDVNYFTKLFKKQIGKTPKEYRIGITHV